MFVKGSKAFPLLKGETESTRDRVESTMSLITLNRPSRRWDYGSTTFHNCSSWQDSQNNMNFKILCSHQSIFHTASFEPWLLFVCGKLLFFCTQVRMYGSRFDTCKLSVDFSNVTQKALRELPLFLREKIRNSGDLFRNEINNLERKYKDCFSQVKEHCQCIPAPCHHQSQESMRISSVCVVPTHCGSNMDLLWVWFPSKWTCEQMSKIRTDWELILCKR